MKNLSKNQLKHLCGLRFLDKMIELQNQGMSIQEITDYINKKSIPNSKFKGTTLSKTKIFSLLKMERKKLNDDDYKNL